MKNNQWLTYEEAKRVVQPLGLKSQKEWQKWSKSGMRPENIPTNPHHTYKGRGLERIW